MEWFTLCPSIPVLPGFCSASWAWGWPLLTYSGGAILPICFMFFDLWYIHDIKAAQDSQSPQQKYEHPCGDSLKSISKDRSLTVAGLHCETQIPPLDGKDVQGACNTLFKTLLDETTRGTKRMRTAKSGNPVITVVHQSGVFDMKLLYCICLNAVDRDEQLLQSGLFPSSYKQIEKLPSPSQCWMTSWQIIWSARPQHSNTTSSFKA